MYGLRTVGMESQAGDRSCRWWHSLDFCLDVYWEAAGAEFLGDGGVLVVSSGGWSRAKHCTAHKAGHPHTHAKASIQPKYQ